jgi:homoaconitate hydratase
MGSTEAKAYLASPEVVAASAMNGKISGPGWYEQPIGVEKVVLGEGNGILEQDRAMSVEEALDKIIAEAGSLISGAEKSILGGKFVAKDDEALTEIFPGFPEKVEGEIVFCDADNLNTDGSESRPDSRTPHRC